MSEPAAMTYDERVELAATELARWSVASRDAAVMALRRAGVPELIADWERCRAERDALRAENEDLRGVIEVAHQDIAHWKATYARALGEVTP